MLKNALFLLKNCKNPPAPGPSPQTPNIMISDVRHCISANLRYIRTHFYSIWEIFATLNCPQDLVVCTTAVCLRPLVPKLFW